MPPRINPFTGQPNPYSTMGDFLQRAPGDLGRGIVGAVGGLPQGPLTMLDMQQMGMQQQPTAISDFMNRFAGGAAQIPGALGMQNYPGSQPNYGVTQDLQAVLGQIPGAVKDSYSPGPLFPEVYAMDPNSLFQRWFGAGEPPVQGPEESKGFPGMTFSAAEKPQPSGGGGSMSFQGFPFPEAPTMQAPQVDIGAMYDPIIAGLKDPDRIRGATKLESISQVLGGAAEGAFRGLNQFQRGGVGSVLAGAGAGASAASTELRREEQALEAQHQEAVQRMQHARAAVQSQKAGAEIGLATAVSEAANKTAELKFNRDVQASIMSHTQVQSLGNGMVAIQSFDPKTGQGSLKMVETDARGKMLQEAYIMSQIEKNKRGTLGRREPKIVMDGKEYNKSAIFGSSTSAYQTPLEMEAEELTFRAMDNPTIRAQYAAALEEYIEQSPSPYLNAERETAPDHLLSDFIFQTMLRDPAQRATMWQAVSGGKAGAAQEPPKQKSLAESFGPPPLRYGY